MNVTREMCVKGLTHDDFFVRCSVLNTFHDTLDLSAEVAKAAIEAIARYGWSDAFEFPHTITFLPQDQETVEWVIKQLSERTFRGPKSGMRLHLVKWFSQAPIALIAPNLDRIEKAFGNQNPMHGILKLSDCIQAAKERVKLGSETDDRCLARLEKVLAECHASDVFPHKPLMHAERLCERLARTHDRSRIAQRVFEWLSDGLDCDVGGNPSDWRAGIAIRLAGLLRLREVAPLLLKMFDPDWDWWNEEIESAFTTMGDEAVFSEIFDRFPELADHARLYLSAVIEKARVPRFENCILELLDVETDCHVRINLGRALALYGTDGSIKAAQRVYEDHSGDIDAFVIAETLYAFYRLLGADDRPELPGWRKTMEAQHARSKAIFAALN